MRIAVPVDEYATARELRCNTDGLSIGERITMRSSAANTSGEAAGVDMVSCQFGYNCDLPGVQGARIVLPDCDSFKNLLVRRREQTRRRRRSSVDQSEVRHVEQSTDSDESDCMELERRPSKELRLHWSSSTSIAKVGLQIWPASALLAEYIICRADVKGAFVLELGAGCSGLPGLMSSRRGAAEVLLTDGTHEALVALNETLLLNTRCIPTSCKVECRLLRWGSTLPGWLLQKLTAYEKVIIVAAECAYDIDLTEKFLSTVNSCAVETNARLEIILGVERRICFSSEEMRVVSTHYDHLFSSLHRNGMFRVQRLCVGCNTDAPGQVFPYNRSGQMELWRLLPSRKNTSRSQHAKRPKLCN